ncbi:MAG: hypothetical protein EXQ86_07790 [Rhodospirillales bacterium]|nr:hypothetical protein [Rhodospirillales bacterium]
MDRDALHILPLTILPLETPSLRRARLIKNLRLRSVVELFSGRETGSGQMEIEDVPLEFSWFSADAHPDLGILRKVGNLPSFDVYSLRISLRQLGIPVNDHTHLRLSEAKSKELAGYMTKFTRPLIVSIYGDEGVTIENFDDVLKLFKSPDREKALERLKRMAEKLKIAPGDVPKFLEDYGDIFLSLSFYRECLDSISKIISEFLETLIVLRTNYAFKNNALLMQTTDVVESTMNELLASLTGRFEAFDRQSRNMWDEISAERFRKVESLIRGFHTTIGGVLCGLAVKMEAWHRIFPSASAGSPSKRAEFILSEMRYGFGDLRKINRAGPAIDLS